MRDGSGISVPVNHRDYPLNHEYHVYFALRCCLHLATLSGAGIDACATCCLDLFQGGLVAIACFPLPTELQTVGRIVIELFSAPYTELYACSLVRVVCKDLIAFGFDPVLGYICKGHTAAILPG